MSLAKICNRYPTVLTNRRAQVTVPRFPCQIRHTELGPGEGLALMQRPNGQGVRDHKRPNNDSRSVAKWKHDAAAVRPLERVRCQRHGRYAQPFLTPS